MRSQPAAEALSCWPAVLPGAWKNSCMTHRSSASQLRRWLPTLAIGPLMVWLVVVPIVYLVVSSFKPTGFVFDEGFTLGHYRDLLTDPSLVRIFWNTTVFAIGSTAGALVIGGGLAWLVERTDMPARRVARAMIILPMATPPVLLAIAWVMLLDPQVGYLNSLGRAITRRDGPIFNVFGLHGMIFVEAIALVPSSFLILSPAFRNMDPSLEDAAFASGAGLWTVLRKIVFPLLRPAILGAGVFLFMACYVIFDVPGIIGVPAGWPVFSTSIVNSALHSPTGLPEYGRLSVLAVLLLAILLTLAFVYGRLIRRTEKYVTMAGKGYRARLYSLGKWRSVAVLVVAGYFCLAVVLPLLMLVWTSLLPYRTGVSATAFELLGFANYVDLANNERFFGAAWNTTRISLLAATIVAALSLGLSWVLIRTRSPGRKVLDALSFVPVALAGVMMGSSLIFVYLSIHVIPLYGTIWIILVAYVTIYIAFGTKVTNAALIQMTPDLEDAGAASGANRTYVLRRITVPLMTPALVGLWIWVVAHCVRELSSALMLQGRGNMTLSTLLWDYWSGGRPTAAAAVGVLMVIALLGLVGFWQAVSRRGDAISTGR